MTNFSMEYDVKEMLGKGAFSEVKQCQARRTLVDFAVKIIDISAAITAGRQRVKERSLQREIDITRQLHHPNVLEIHHTYTEGPL